MSTSNIAASAVSPATQLPLSGGLFLQGTVIAVRTEEKEWEKETYTQTTVEISDGKNVYALRHRHDENPYTPPQMFKEVKVRVSYAMTEKGRITVRGVVL